MNRYARHHCGLDHSGNRHWRMKDSAAMRNWRQHAALCPKVIVATRVVACREIWRNGLQKRRYLLATGQVRADRRSFLTTLPRAPLVSPVLAVLAWPRNRG